MSTPSEQVSPGSDSGRDDGPDSRCIPESSQHESGSEDSSTESSDTSSVQSDTSSASIPCPPLPADCPEELPDLGEKDPRDEHFVIKFTSQEDEEPRQEYLHIHHPPGEGDDSTALHLQTGDIVVRRVGWEYVNPDDGDDYTTERVENVDNKHVQTTRFLEREMVAERSSELDHEYQPRFERLLAAPRYSHQSFWENYNMGRVPDLMAHIRKDKAHVPLILHCRYLRHAIVSAIFLLRKDIIPHLCPAAVRGLLSEHQVVPISVKDEDEDDDDDDEEDVEDYLRRMADEVEFAAQQKKNAERKLAANKKEDAATPFQPPDFYLAELYNIRYFDPPRLLPAAAPRARQRAVNRYAREVALPGHSLVTLASGAQALLRKHCLYDDRRVRDPELRRPVHPERALGRELVALLARVERHAARFTMEECIVGLMALHNRINDIEARALQWQSPQLFGARCVMRNKARMREGMPFVSKWAKVIVKRGNKIVPAPWCLATATMNPFVVQRSWPETVYGCAD